MLDSWDHCRLKILLIKKTFCKSVMEVIYLLNCLMIIIYQFSSNRVFLVTFLNERQSWNMNIYFTKILEASKQSMYVAFCMDVSQECFFCSSFEKLVLDEQIWMLWSNQWQCVELVSKLFFNIRLLYGKTGGKLTSFRISQ